MPKGTKLAFTSPEGRLVQGDAFEMNTKDKTGAPRVVKSGPNIGQPAPQMILVVAFAKTDPAWPPFEKMLKSKAAEDFPQLFPNAARGDYTPSHPNFSFKIQDGDGFDGDGKPNNVKEGHAGHWIVKFTSGYPAKVFNKGHYAPQEQIFKVAGQPAPGPRRGDYVRVSGTIEGNDDVARPAIYVNCSLVEFSRAGVEIVSGPSAEAAFGGAGVTHTSDRTGGLIMKNGQSYDAFKAAGWSDEQMIAAGHAERPAPPPAPLPPPPPALPAPAARVMLTGQTYEAMVAAGWSDEQMIAAGHMAPPVVAPPVPPSTVTPPPPPPAPTPGASTSAAPPPPPSVTPSPSNPPPPPYSDFAKPPAGKTMTPAAGGATYEQLTAAGWTDAQLIQHGMMLPQ